MSLHRRLRTKEFYPRNARQGPYVMAMLIALVQDKQGRMVKRFKKLKGAEKECDQPTSVLVCL
jgi:hypothetical protein